MDGRGCCEGGGREGGGGRETPICIWHVDRGWKQELQAEV